MKTLILSLALFCAPIAASAYDEARMMDVIAQTETGGHWNGVPGGAGELSDWQITHEVWLQEMPGISFSHARVRATAAACAVKHLRRIVASLRTHGYAVTPQRVATAWNIGIGGLLRRHGQPTAYGERAAALYYAP